MIVISRKRILLIATILCVSVFAFSLNTYSSKKAVETVALPVSNKVIVIDAGHGKPDEGAVCQNRKGAGDGSLCPPRRSL